MGCRSFLVCSFTPAAMYDLPYLPAPTPRSFASLLGSQLWCSLRHCRSNKSATSSIAPSPLNMLPLFHLSLQLLRRNPATNYSALSEATTEPCAVDYTDKSKASNCMLKRSEESCCLYFCVCVRTYRSTCACLVLLRERERDAVDQPKWLSSECLRAGPYLTTVDFSIENILDDAIILG